MSRRYEAFHNAGFSVNIRSEIDPLESVIVHVPGPEHEYVLPENITEWIAGDGKLEDNPDYLLFDDLIHVEKAVEEHITFQRILKKFVGEKSCMELTDLLAEVCDVAEHRRGLINDCVELERELYGSVRLTDDVVKELMDMKSEDLVHVMLTGRRRETAAARRGGEEPAAAHSIFKNPLPNLIFTRDVAAVVGNQILLMWGRRGARKRETIISRYIFTRHPIFKDYQVYDFNSVHPELTLEGGDVVVLDDDVVCIGMSERTPMETVDALAPFFFRQGFHTVFAVDLPKKRSLMHLDTIFTRISVDEVLVYPPLFIKPRAGTPQIQTWRLTRGQSFKDVKPSSETLLKLLAREGLYLKPIPCGGKDPLAQDREQWTDGANAFAVGPGRIITYQRNQHTLDCLAESGYHVISADDFLGDPFKAATALRAPKLVVTIESGELSRGRGGARCLTLPISRQIFAKSPKKKPRYERQGSSKRFRRLSQDSDDEGRHSD